MMKSARGVRIHRLRKVGEGSFGSRVVSVHIGSSQPVWSAGVSVAHAREVEGECANTSLNVYMNVRQHGERRTAKEVGHDHPEALRGVLIREKPRVHELPTKDVRADDNDALGGLVARRVRVDVRDLDLGALRCAVGVHEASDAVGAGHGSNAIGRLAGRQEGVVDARAGMGTAGRTS